MNANQYADLFAEVTADVERLEAELAQVQAVRKYLENKVEKNGSGVSDHSSERAPRSRPFAGMKQIGAAAIVLQDAKQPLKTREIAKRLIDGGFPAKDIARLKTSLFTTMTRKPEVFKKAGVGLWALAKTEA